MQTPNSPSDPFTYPTPPPIGDHTPSMLPQTDTPTTFDLYANTRRCGTLDFSSRVVLRIFVLHGRAQPFVGRYHDRRSVAGPTLDRQYGT
jgi:hypothetical protein